MSEDEPILSAEQAKKLLATEVANIMKKLKAGKSLTKGEQETIRKFTERQDTAEAEEGTYIKQKVGLAKALDISRTTLDGYLKSPNFPLKETGKGWHLEKCLEYIERLKGSRPTNPDVPRGNPEALGEKAGAQYALARLSRMEVQAFADTMAAYDSGDVESMTISMKRWLDLTTPLRDFERIIDKDKRDSGETLQRNEVEDFLRMFGQALAYAEEAFLGRHAIMVSELSEDERNDPRTLRQSGKGMLYDKVNESFDQACNQEKFAGWMAVAFAEGLRPVLKEAPAES